MKKRCKQTFKRKERYRISYYQVRCPKEAKRNGYCIEHHTFRQEEKPSSKRHLESPRPLTNISRGVSNQEKFSRKFGKGGKIKIKEKVK